MKLKNLPFQVNVINEIKQLVLGEKDKSLSCYLNSIISYCNIVINTSVGVITKIY